MTQRPNRVSLLVRILFLLCWLLALAGGPVTSSAALPASSWVLENPIPWTQNLLGLACPTATNCVAAGDGGLVIVTSNSGKTWHRGATGTTATLFSVSCSSTSICYAAGAKGLIIHTVDGGRTWTSVHHPAALNVTSIACPTATTCLVADGRNILRTTDSGRSWTDHTPPGRSWNAVTCTSLHACYGAGGSVIVIGDSGTGQTDGVAFTRNLGQNWHVQDISVNGGQTVANAVGCSGATCFAVGTTASGRYNPAPNGGIAWDVSHHGVGRAISQWPLRGIACASPTACIAVGDRGTIARLDASGHGQPLSTGNPLDDLVNLTAVACPTSRACYAVGWTGAIIRSIDAGLHWTLLTHAITYDGLTSVSCTATVCYAAGSKTILRLNSRDWTIVHSSSFGAVAAISCPTDDICYTAGTASSSYPAHPEILKTADGGRTWHHVMTPIDAEVATLSDIACPTADVCYALGQMNYNISDNTPVFLTVSNGGGTSVRSSPLPTEDQASHLACPAVDMCLVTHERAFGGGIIRTDDGGHTWTPATGLLPNTDFGPITCSDSHTCYATGVNEGQTTYALHSVLVTTHDGLSWSDKLVPYHNGLNGIGCLSRSSCYAVGSGGRILRTGDGGGTWQTEVRYSPAAHVFLDAVACRAGSECYAVGYPGIILHKVGS